MISKQAVSKIEKDYCLSKEKINKLISQMTSRFEKGTRVIVESYTEDFLTKLANRPKGFSKKIWLNQCIISYLSVVFEISQKEFFETLSHGTFDGKTMEFDIGEQ